MRRPATAGAARRSPVAHHDRRAELEMKPKSSSDGPRSGAKDSTYSTRGSGRVRGRPATRSPSGPDRSPPAASIRDREAQMGDGFRGWMQRRERRHGDDSLMPARVVADVRLDPVGLGTVPRTSADASRRTPRRPRGSRASSAGSRRRAPRARGRDGAARRRRGSGRASPSRARAARASRSSSTSRSTAASSSAGGTTSVTSPIASASSAPTRRRRMTMSFARPRPDEPREPLRAAAPGDHPEVELGQAELDVVGGDAEVARERELEPDAEACSRGASRSPASGSARARRRSRRAE